MYYEVSIPVITALIIGLAQVAKGLGLPSKFVPLLDIVLGVAFAFLYSLITPATLPTIIFTGIIAGLTACGLYSGVKNTVNG